MREIRKIEAAAAVMIFGLAVMLMGRPVGAAVWTQEADGSVTANGGVAIQENEEAEVTEEAQPVSGAETEAKPEQAQAASGGLQFELDGEEVAVVGYTGNGPEAVIPLSVPASVTKIGMSAFSGCEELRSLSFEAGETTLTLVCGSFVGCGNLASVDLGTRPIKGVSYDGNTGSDGNLFSGAAIEELTVPATADFSELYSFCERGWRKSCR